YFNPDRYPDRAKDRFAYVVGRMKEDKAIGDAEARQLTGMPRLAAIDRPRRETGFHFIDYLAREAKSVAGGLTSESYTVRSTINPALQRATETALQDGLAAYEKDSGRAQFQAPEANLGEALRRSEAGEQAGKPRGAAAARGAPPAALRCALAGGRDYREVRRAGRWRNAE